MPGDISCQNAGANHMFGNYRKTGSIPIQAVGAAKDKRFSLLLIIPCQSIGQRIGVIIHGRMSGHTRRLIHYQNVLILINNRQRQVHRNHLLRNGSFLDMHCQYIPRR